MGTCCSRPQKPVLSKHQSFLNFFICSLSSQVGFPLASQAASLTELASQPCSPPDLQALCISEPTRAWTEFPSTPLAALLSSTLPPFSNKKSSSLGCHPSQCALVVMLCELYLGSLRTHLLPPLSGRDVGLPMMFFLLYPCS